MELQLKNAGYHIYLEPNKIFYSIQLTTERQNSI